MTRTNAAGILTILVRTAALWMVVHLVVGGMTAIRMLRTAQIDGRSMALAIGLTLLAAALMWVFADIVARLALARPNQPAFESDLDAGQWQVLAFSVVGLWQAATGALGFATYLGMRIAFGSTGVDVGHSIDGRVLEAGLQLVLGLMLLFGAPRLVAFVRARGAADAAPHADDAAP
jgi:hypothetical protein